MFSTASTVSLSAPLVLRKATQRRAPRSSRSVTTMKMVSVQEAAKLQKEGHKYLDVRTHQEFEAGHAPGAVNIPIMNAGPSGAMTPNSQFLDGVHKAIPDKAAKILVACKAGPRAKSAAGLLEGDGYSNLTEVEGGWMAWAAAGLPTQTRMIAE